MKKRYSRKGADGRSLLSATVAIAVLFQFGIASFALGAPIASNKVGISMTGFKLSGAFAQTGIQQSGTGGFANGNITDYPEGACLPVLIEVKNNSNAAGDTVISPIFDYLNPDLGIEGLEMVGTSLSGSTLKSGADDLNDFTTSGGDLTGATAFTTKANGTVSAVVTGPYSGADAGTTAATVSDTFRHYNVSLTGIPSGGTVNLVFCARLGVDASEYNGSSLSVRTAQGGNENVPISTNQLLELPSLTISKTVVGGTAVASDFSFNVSPAINSQSVFSIAADQSSVTIDNIPVNGEYSITENGAADYTFTSGTGTNCTFSGSTGTATVASGDNATNATCAFTNTYQTPAPTTATLTVVKTVVGGDLGASAFSLSVSGGNASPSSFSGNADGTSVTVDIGGQYSVTEDAVTNYDPSYSAGCSGTMTSEGATCTVTNTYTPPAPTTATLTVVKTVVGGDLGASAFSLSVSGGNASPSSFSGNAEGTSVTVDIGSAYTVSEDAAPNYTVQYSEGCSATMTSEGATCTVTNTYVAPPPPEPTTATLTVVKTVVGGDLGASAFSLSVSGGNASPSSFSGNTDGTSVTVDIGSAYTVSEEAATNYTVQYSEGCSAAMSAEGATCTVTNTYVAPPPPEPTTATLTVVKTVVGTEEISPSAFTLNVSGGNASPSSFSGNGSGTSVTVDIGGQYSVTEDAYQNFTASYSEGCSGTMTAQGATCTVTNTYVAPPPQETEQNIFVQLNIVNDNGGSATQSSFSAAIDANTVSFGSATYLSVGIHTVTASGPSGYVLSFSGDCDSTGSVNLPASSSKTCTVTADDVPPVIDPPTGGGGASPLGTIIVVTKVVNDNGGGKLPSSFLMSVTDGLGSPISSFGGVDNPGFGSTIPPGTYGVGGPDDAGYAKTLTPSCSGSVGSGQTVICTVTYDDIAPPSGSPPAPPAPPAPPSPEPEVLGATDEPKPEPKVLGATDELPRTGAGLGTLFVLIPLAALALRRRD